MMKTYVYSLCKDRHRAPTNDGIYPTVVPYNIAHDPVELERWADYQIPLDCNKLAVYVTGLTVAIMAVVAVCVRRRIRLSLYHLNPNTGRYYRQDVI